MNFDQGPPDGFSGASTAAPALLDASHFHCAAFWDAERKVRVRTVSRAQKRGYHMHLENTTLGQTLQGLPVPPEPCAWQDMGSYVVQGDSGSGVHPAYTKILQWTDSERKTFEVSAW